MKSEHPVHRLTEAEKIRRLPWLMAGDAANIVFVLLTFSGSVFVLYLNDLGLNTGQIGVMLSLVPFCGMIAPLVAPVAERMGYKRIFMRMRALRILPIALLLLTPMVLQRYGQSGAFRWVAGSIFAFAIGRGISETGGFSWRKEIVPDAIRGKFSAISSMITTVASIITVLGAAYVIDHSQGLQRFMVLIAVGVFFGILSIVFFSRSPQENADRRNPSGAQQVAGTRQALKDRPFLLFLLALGLAMLGSQMAASFIPLFMKEKVGLADGIVVLLGIGTYLGALISSYFWGWAADRYSSKPVMQISTLLLLILPLAWMFQPRHSSYSAAIAMSIAFVAGIANLSWQISWGRYLYVNAISSTNRSAYLAIYFAWLSFVVGLGPLIAGRILDYSQRFLRPIPLGPFVIDAYTPLFILSILLILLTLGIVPKLRTETNVTFKRFAGMFLRGNPVRAMRLLVQYNQSGDEMTRIATAEKMGDTHSPLTSLELMESLHDPSFNVRYEAIHSIGRLPEHRELVEAIIQVLVEGEPELGMAAARALGRLGDARAIPALRATLNSPYDLIKVNSARSLAILDDVESIPELRAHLAAEQNQHLKVSYASALGRLGDETMLPEFFRFLQAAALATARGELGLAIARLVSSERYYLQHWHAFRTNYGTAAAQALLNVAKQLRQAQQKELAREAEQCAEMFGTDEIQTAWGQLQALLQASEPFCKRQIMQQTLRNLQDLLTYCDPTRFEVALLALQTLSVVWQHRETMPDSGTGKA
ncbi:MAG: MFS transporter [Chloroflexi bacterium]|nr:MFS transporter [Chloroflexota bacterium]